MKPSHNTNEYSENPVFMDLVSLLGNGFVLSLFNINFLFFEYLFPIVGSAIMLYGCHLIKSYNRHFLFAYYIAFIRFMMMMVNFLLDWTTINTNHYIAYIQIALSAIIIVFLFIHLDKGFSSMYADAGILKYRHRLLTYIFLYLCNVVSIYLTIELSIIGAIVSILILLLNVLYIALAFLRIGKDLTTSSLEIELSTYTKEVFHKYIKYIALYILLLGITIYYSNKSSLYASTPPDTNITSSQDHEAIKSKLISLGMKKNIVSDLSAKEYDYLSTVQSITTQIDKKNANGGVIQFISYHFQLKDCERILVYYEWLKEPGNRLFQVLEFDIHNFCYTFDLNSGCLYNDLDTNMPIKIASVDNSINIFGNPYTEQKLSNEGELLRGYLAFSYNTSDASRLDLSEMKINLYYQVSIFNLPYLKIVDYMNYYDKYKTSIVYNKLTIPITTLFQ